MVCDAACILRSFEIHFRCSTKRKLEQHHIVSHVTEIHLIDHFTRVQIKIRTERVVKCGFAEGRDAISAVFILWSIIE